MKKDKLTDTDEKIEQYLIERYKQLPSWQKIEIVCALILTCQKLALAGISERYPNASEEEIRLRLAALWLDKEIMLKVYNWDIDQKGL
ncbi:MAG: hypothetical protein A2Y62_14395 [Candidatus Fischerbacteria bacterium RBG_13_37_8]|uniref:Uncharacterized protein n=1 Tax=Candidatus Fischerbacteria bacterium RBG_13_37_8 TaxID=1817863 RepID=A0A1F5VPP2_9BACT|nr:MAG: hypothetical protein A2Y62_14395 [Candidatus Fischerbacteria bacterium RBG_13_37_8]